MRRLAAILLVLAGAGSAGAADTQPGAADYCANFADRAADARLSWQTANLERLQQEVTAKIVALEARQAELRSWIARRDAMLKAAAKELVDIYAKMDAEAAARQLAELDATTAASVLRQLSPRAASAILDAMDVKHAAALARAIAAATGPAAGGNGT